MPSFPEFIVSLNNPASTDPRDTPSHADQHADANDEIEAIEIELGTNPAGASATVKARFEAIEAITVAVVTTGDAASTRPELRDHASAGTPISFASPSLDTSVTHIAMTGIVGRINYPGNVHSYADVASSIGTGDFDIAARIISAHVTNSAASTSVLAALSLSVTDAARTAGTRLSTKGYAHCPSATVLYYTQQVGTAEAGGVIRPLRYPCIIRISRSGTTVSYWVSFTDGLTWSLLSTGTSSLDVGKVGLWANSASASAPVEAIVDWVRSV